MLGNLVRWPKMGPHGSLGAHTKTGRSRTARDHFQTPPDPQKNRGSLKKKFGGSGSNRLICWTTMLMGFSRCSPRSLGILPIGGPGPLRIMLWLSGNPEIWKCGI